MVELICAIPEELGWAMVGALAVMVVLMAHKLYKDVILEIIEEWREERGE